MSSYDLGFIGAGNMAEALCRGILAAKLLPASRIAASDISGARREVFGRLGVTAVADNLLTAKESDIVLLAVKPQDVDGVLREVAAQLGPRKLVISIAAGIKTAKIEKACAGCRVVRAMPNTPMLVGEGMTALCAGTGARPEDMETAARIFRAGGRVVTVDEAAMNIVTALSGTGPGYFFYFVEAMIEAGVAEGLTRPLAETLVSQTLLGAGRLLAKSGESAAELRRKVTSPGGTTEAAVRLMDEGRVRETLIAAVRRAAQRAGEMSSG